MKNEGQRQESQWKRFQRWLNAPEKQKCYHRYSLISSSRCHEPCSVKRYVTLICEKCGKNHTEVISMGWQYTLSTEGEQRIEDALNKAEEAAEKKFNLSQE